jgi:hypothetical protein
MRVPDWRANWYCWLEADVGEGSTLSCDLPDS